MTEFGWGLKPKYDFGFWQTAQRTQDFNGSFSVSHARVDGGSSGAHDGLMMRWLRTGLGSAVMAGMFACVIAMLVAMPVLRARAEARPCHPAQFASANRQIGTHSHDVGHKHPVDFANHDHQLAVTSAAHTHSEPGERKSSSKADCCLTGGGLAVIATALSLTGPFKAEIRQRLPVSAGFAGLDPSAPRKPPRTNSIAALAA